MSKVEIDNVQAIYRARFGDTGLEKRDRVWKALCSGFFNELIGPGKDILDMACGYGEFINNVSAKSRMAVDMNPDAPSHLRPEVRFCHGPSTKMEGISDAAADVVFTSNFLEHLPNQNACDATFDEVKRVLRPGGRFVILGPNIKYAYREYWDFYDHHLALSHLSLEEGLTQKGFKVIRNIPRFLPFTMKGKAPSGDVLVKTYLKLPFIWPLFGKQFLVVAVRP